VNKIQKPSFNKVHKHSKHDEHQDNCGCTHNHSNEELYGELQEVPAVFSHSTSFELDKEVTGDKLKDCLVDWVESLKLWVSDNKYFIGHIKVFVENKKGFNLWLSTTGKKVNIKASGEYQDNNIKNITINMTAIIFGTDEQTLRSVTLENLDKNLPHHSE
jgi:SHS2 domain-containing protein